MKLQEQHSIRRAMTIWLASTAIYLIAIVLGESWLAQSEFDESIEIILLTLIYSLISLYILHRVIDEEKEYKKQLKTMLLTMQKNELELQRRLSEELILNHVIATAASAREPTEILQVICKELSLALHVPQAGIALLNNDRTHETVVAEYRTPDRPTALGIILPIEGNAATQTVIEKREPLVLLNAQTDPRQSILHQLEKERGTVSLLIVPLVIRDQAIGTLGLESAMFREFTADEINLAQNVANAASQVLESARLTNELRRELGERKHAEEKLQASLTDIERAQTKARSILDAAADSMLLITTDQKIVSVNWSFCRNFFGKHPREVVGHTLQDHQEEFERLFENPTEFHHLMETASQENDQSSASIVVQVSPRRREMQLVSTPVRTITNEYLGRLFVFHDITKEREVNRLRNEFVSMVSHELRAPLTSIKGYVDLLQVGAVGAVNPEQSDFLGIIKENTDRLVKLISDLLDISRIETGRLELQCQPVDLALLIRQVINNWRPQIIAKQQHIKLELECSSLVAWVDRDRMIQVLTNLISNAHKYTPSGGTITIVAESMDDAACIQVQDTGIGISEKEVGRLFSHFYRTSNAIAQKIDGTGLGLAITRSIVELHGGQISVESNLGQGTNFHFTVPTLAPVGKPTLETTAVRGKRILIAEPDAEVASLIERYLRRAGYETTIVTTSQDIIPLAQTHEAALMTLALVWPDTDGFRLLEMLKEDPTARRIPVMVISALAENESGKMLGAVDYVLKPFSEQELLTHVGRLLAHKPLEQILVAQEDATSRQMVNSLLTRAGYDVLEAADDKETLGMAKEQRPGLIFLDLKLPLCGGIGTLEQLRTEQDTSEIPVVIMADHEGISDDQRAIAAEWRAPTILTKPFTASKLATAIHQATHS